jgi:hypothetical protein
MMMALVGSDCVTYSVRFIGRERDAIRAIQLLLDGGDLAVLAHAVDAVELDLDLGASSNFLKPYGGSVKKITPFFMRVTSFGLENFLPRTHRHRRLLLRLEVELLDAAAAGVGQQDAVLVEMARPLAPASRQTFMSGFAGAGRIQEFFEAAFLRPLPHLVAGHVGEQ